MINQDERNQLVEGMMTVHDVARYLRLSEAKIYQMAHGSELPAIRIGKSWRFKKELIDDWLRNQAAAHAGVA